MTQPKQRHPNLANLDEVDALSREKGARFGFTAKMLGVATGAKGIGCTWYEQPPGRAAFPRHFHCANEEAMFVLDGTGQVRIGDATLDVRAGDWVTFPVGPEHAHCVTNTGDTPLRYLCLSTQQSVEVVGYPDSNKVGALAMAPGTNFMDPAWHRGFYRQSDKVDYYDGEPDE